MREKAEEHTGDAASTSFHFSSVGQIDSKSPLILPGQAVAESSKQPGSQPNQSPAEIVLAQTTERREDSTCFPLSLPTLSWRRQEFISGGKPYLNPRLLLGVFYCCYRVFSCGICSDEFMPFSWILQRL